MKRRGNYYLKDSAEVLVLQVAASGVTEKDDVLARLKDMEQKNPAATRGLQFLGALVEQEGESLYGRAWYTAPENIIMAATVEGAAEFVNCPVCGQPALMLAGVVCCDTEDCLNYPKPAMPRTACRVQINWREVE